MNFNLPFMVLAAFTALVGGCDDKPEPKKPNDSAPQTTPAQATPAQATPAPATPIPTRPSDTKPTDAQPTDSEPTEPKPTDTPPNNTKSTDTKPVDGKPEDKKPFATPQPTLETLEVTLDGKTFRLEKAANDEQRFRGLSGRTSIAADGGMIFLFKSGSRQNFVMRDCPIPIDIVYVDATGRITAMHNMQPEAERTEAEKVLTAEAQIPEWARINEAYEGRLKKYSSRYDAIVVIELKGGTLNIEGSNPKGLNLKVGQKLDLDMAALRKLAK